jgi:hypothetical protein
MEGASVNFLSGEPIVLVGPGSEWFWSMAQFVIVAVTLVGIYYQFRLQRSANAFDMLSRIQAEWNSEFFTRTKLEAARTLKAGGSTSLASRFAIGNFWEGVGALVQGGHVDARVVYDAVGNSTRFWWEIMKEAFYEAREQSESSDVMSHFESLAERFASFAEQDGTEADFDNDTLLADLEGLIPAWEDRIRLLEASRNA